MWQILHWELLDSNYGKLINYNNNFLGLNIKFSRLIPFINNNFIIFINVEFT